MYECDRFIFMFVLLYLLVILQANIEQLCFFLLQSLLPTSQQQKHFAISKKKKVFVSVFSYLYYSCSFYFIFFSNLVSFLLPKPYTKNLQLFYQEDLVLQYRFSYFHQNQLWNSHLCNLTCLCWVGLLCRRKVTHFHILFYFVWSLMLILLLSRFFLFKSLCFLTIFGFIFG